MYNVGLCRHAHAGAHALYIILAADLCVADFVEIYYYTKEAIHGNVVR